VNPEVSRRLARALQHAPLAGDRDYRRRAQEAAAWAASWAELPADVREPAEAVERRLGHRPLG